MKKILVINGANINMIGTREPAIYGTDTIETLNNLCISTGKKYNTVVDCFHSNIEGEIINCIQQSKGVYSHIIINAGAYSHTSIAIMDALLSVDIPVHEVHLSNIYKREEFRHYSYMSKVAISVVCGMGIQGYAMIIEHILKN